MRSRLLSPTRLLAAGVLASALVLAAPASPPRAMSVDDLLTLRRVSDPQVSPDGQHIAYVVTDPIKAENRTNSDIWVIKADGSEPARALTASPKHDRHPRWSPDGRWIAFESTRSGEPQIYLLPMQGGEPRAVTSLATGASEPVWTPDGSGLAFVSEVFPEFSDRPFAEADRLNRERLDTREKNPVKARLYDQLLYRHWDSWADGRRKHVFLVPVAADGTPGEPRNLTPGANDGLPNASTFDAGNELTFSPDGAELVTAMPPVPLREQAWSTNYDLWRIELKTGRRENLTAQNLAADGLPRFSPDGRYLAYRAQATPGFEADRWQLWLLDRATGERRSLTAQWDRSVDTFTWAPDSGSLYLEAQDRGTEPIFRLELATGTISPVVQGGANNSVSPSRDGRWVAFVHHALNQPPEIARLDLGAAAWRYVTQTNTAQLGTLAFSSVESVTVMGAPSAPGGAPTPVQMWIVKPPQFDPAQKYPLVFWVHGGPQSAFLDAWSTRWNAQTWAAQGYVVALPNPRGSTGFGQQFTNEISRDWGGRVFADLVACLNYLKAQPYVRTSRMAAAGASFGGYMMNWFQGHLPEFRCLVNHNGVFNFHSMYGTTEELWFDEYEHGVPWNTPEFETFSPHRFAANFKTPMLIIANELDFRVPLSEGMQAFTVLQRKGVRSKLLIYPDEGHWVLKPANSELWHRTVFEWLGEYLR